MDPWMRWQLAEETGHPGYQGPEPHPLDSGGAINIPPPTTEGQVITIICKAPEGQFHKQFTFVAIVPPA